MSILRLAARPAFLSRPVLSGYYAAQRQLPARAWYSSGGGLNKEVIEARVLNILKGFEKVNTANLTPAASFSKDLGLDSLDAVEVVMSIEEEFSIEIPDVEADEIQTVQQAIDYIAKTPAAA